MKELQKDGPVIEISVEISCEKRKSREKKRLKNWSVIEKL
jgi:hypothetical protein